MSKWQRPRPELVARFAACLPREEGIERRQMFGCPCAFFNGNMFAGVHEHRLIVRLAEPERAALVAHGDVGPFVVMGRTMREYVAFERPLARTPRDLAAWLTKALAFARSLPPKAATARREAAGRQAAMTRRSTARTKPARG